MHCSLVIGVDAAPETRVIRSFSLATFMTASAVEVVTRSTITSTFSVSIHSRALIAAMSPLFWWSAEITSILKSGFSLAMKSATAICTAASDPGPARSE